MTRLALALLATCLVTGAAACESSPTLDVPFSVAGTWSGVLPIRTPDGDWRDAASVTLAQNGDAVTGEILSADGARYAVSGTATRDDGMSLRLEGLPGTSTCAGVILTADDFALNNGYVRRISGRASGRCFGTIAGEFTLERDR